MRHLHPFICSYYKTELSVLAVLFKEGCRVAPSKNYVRCSNNEKPMGHAPVFVMYKVVTRLDRGPHWRAILPHTRERDHASQIVPQPRTLTKYYCKRKLFAQIASWAWMAKNIDFCPLGQLPLHAPCKLARQHEEFFSSKPRGVLKTAEVPGATPACQARGLRVWRHSW